MPRAGKPAHYRGGYHVAARRVRDAAKADPTTCCWRCGRTLDMHPPHKTGKPPTWTAGHVIDGDPASPLRPEASTCNYRAGAIAGNRKRRQQQRPRRTSTSVRW